MKMIRNGKIAAILLCIVFAAPYFLVPATAATEPLFTITLLAPGNANLVRRQWALIFANSLRNVGIDAQVVYMDWSAIYDRALTPSPENVGKVYDDGGFDALFVGYTPGLVPDPSSGFYGDAAHFAPWGQNYYLWNDTTNNKIIEDFITATTPAERDAAYKRWQQYYVTQMPASMILYETNVAARNPAVSNVEWLHFNARPSPEWFKTSQTEVTYASTGELLALTPPLSNSWYDSIALGPIYSSLVDWSYDLKLIPNLAMNWSLHGNTWVINIRPGVKWHDGVEFTADDALYSFWSNLNSNTGSQFVGLYTSWLGTYTSFQWENGTTTQLVNYGGSTYYEIPQNATGLTEGRIWAPSKYQVSIVQCNVPNTDKPNTLFELLGLTSFMIPKHILEKIPLADWSTHPFNTGVGTYDVQLPEGGTYTAHGPIGTGPYVYMGYDATNQISVEKKNAAYWNRTALESGGMYNVQTYNIKYIAGKESAIAALKNGEVDILDPNYHMQKEAKSGVFEPSWGTVIILPGAGRQELGFNMRHPVFGTGVDTPLGKKDPTKAAEAAAHVRIAMDLLCPKQLLIDSLLAGYGDAGITPALPTQPYYDYSIKPSKYDVELAKWHLAQAGYKIEFAVTPPTIETKGESIFMGEHIHITGTYANLTSGKPLTGYLVQVQESTTNESWPAGYIAQGITDSNGRFDVIIKPAQEGTFFYRVYFPGVPARPDLVGIIPVIDARWSTEVVQIVVGPTVESHLAEMTSSLSALNAQLTAARDDITALRDQVSQLTTVAYVGVLGLLVGLVALAMSFRKKS
jgi:ABC-type transport system substrate-binding protein